MMLRFVNAKIQKGREHLPAADMRMQQVHTVNVMSIHITSHTARPGDDDVGALYQPKLARGSQKPILLSRLSVPKGKIERPTILRLFTTTTWEHTTPIEYAQMTTCGPLQGLCTKIIILHSTHHRLKVQTDGGLMYSLQ